MSDVPFGFAAPGGDPGDWAGKAPLFAELAKLMSWSGGPVNWDLARQLAISQVAPADHKPSPAEQRAIVEAIRLADLWLDPLTTLPSGVRETAAWSRIEWVEGTLPAWSELCNPVASRVVEAMQRSLPNQLQAAGVNAGPLVGIMSQAGGLMFGAQVGQALAGLAAEVLGTTDVGLPMGPAGCAALLPGNVLAFGAGLGVPSDEVRLYLALREAAQHRLFGHVPWVRKHLLDVIDSYAQGITIDTDAIQRAIAELDLQSPSGLQEALAHDIFEPTQSPEQEAVLVRLETALALVEGWVDAVVTTAAAARLPTVNALGETLRRRRATGGPAEQTFATLVGLELRPRRLREASRLWVTVTDLRGVDGRDALWSHPDLLPTSDDLDDPVGFAQRLLEPGEDLLPPADGGGATG